jgi:hypothetical protein
LIVVEQEMNAVVGDSMLEGGDRELRKFEKCRVVRA